MMKTAISDEIVNAVFGAISRGTGHRAVNAQGGDETFDVLQNSDKTWSVQSPDGKEWASIQEDGSLGWRPVDDPGQPGPWEKFSRQGNVLTELSKNGVTRKLYQFMIKDEAGNSGGSGGSSSGTLPRASINGYYSNVFLKGESAFLDLARKLNGENIQPLLKQSVELGSNGRRNFLMTFNTAKAGGLPPFNPDDHPNYFAVLEEMLQEYAEYGQYLYGCAFPDNGLFPLWAGNVSKQVDHWGKLGEIAKKYPNFWGLELTNEINSKGYNEVDQSQFHPISGVICCSGSWTDDGGDSLKYPIQWDMCDFHQRRDYPKSVVDAAIANYPPREVWHKATGLGESVGFGDKALNANREDNPRVAKEIAGTGRGCACMMIYHTQHGGFSQLYDSTEMACGKAWFKELEGV